VPRADIASHDQAYRRGMVLGLTMAEIMTLIVFALLLVVGSVMIVSEDEKRALKLTVDSLREEISEATAGLGADNQTPEDIFRELVLAKKQAAALPGLNARVAELEEKLKQYAQLQDALKVTGEAKTPQAAQDLAERLEIAKAIQELSRSGNLKLDKASLLALLEKAKSAEATAANLRGQVAHLEQVAQASGKGTQYPPCWADEQTGRPEYIFDISIISDGIVIRDNAIPHRATEQAQLPMEGVEFGRRITNAAFVAETRPLLDWSNRQDPVCRFFVRLYDLTGPAEKATFKTGYRTVGGIFYNLLLDAAPDAPR
jgi:hypothetical protein